MARYSDASAALAKNQANVQATKIAPLGYMGEFGSGLWRVFLASGSFTIPAGVKEIRVRVVGGGGGAGGGGCGGGGGGYAHGVFPVTPGDVYAVTVSGKNRNAGGTSSFGSLISATGGGVGAYYSNVAGAFSNSSAGGVGIGGDFQAKGGAGGGVNATNYGGGGGAGSQLGDGGNAGGSGGAGVGGNGSSIGGGGGSAFGPNYHDPNKGGLDALGNSSAGAGAVNPIGALIRFPFDGFTGGGGAVLNSATGEKIGYPGGSGAGGGGSGGSPATGGVSAGLGGVGGGGGGGSNGGNGTASGGIGGGAGNGNGDNYGGAGLVVVEW